MIRYIKAWHRTSAVALGTFLLIHMANRVVALGGQAQHIAFMAAVRPDYC